MKIRNIAAAAGACLALLAVPAAAQAADGFPVYHDTYGTQAACTAEGKSQVGAGTADDYYCEASEGGWDLYLEYWV